MSKEKKEEFKKFIVQKDFVLDKAYKRGNEIVLSNPKAIELLIKNKFIK